MIQNHFGAPVAVHQQRALQLRIAIRQADTAFAAALGRNHCPDAMLAYRNSISLRGQWRAESHDVGRRLSPPDIIVDQNFRRLEALFRQKCVVEPKG